MVSQRQAQVEENKQRFIPIVKCIILCGQQNLAYRCHRDDGDLNIEEGLGPVQNDGSFRALLRFWIDAGHETLRKHLETTSSKATYISKLTQNEL